ncbi:MAG TPA: hypothetical protein ENJ28_07730 [Gammaproteobacteria bacterium]|nr:hypothetical protein [Gammaproteobacteria bacterium]
MIKLFHLFLIIVTVVALSACASNGNSQLPLTLTKISATTKPTPNLFVMFPGINSPGTDFIHYGFVEMFRKKYPNVDIVLVDTRLAYITAGNIAERIQHDVILPALNSGYKNIWFMGISLGGLSALTYHQTYHTPIKGIVLIAPYLGTQYPVDDLLSSHLPPAVWSRQQRQSSNKTVQLWRHILEITMDKDSGLQLFLGYGDSDRYNTSHRFLARLLDSKKVFIEKGGHNWTVWKKLWQTMLNANVFTF